MKAPFSRASKRPAPDIKTRAELDHRLGQRAKPKLERHLTPHGAVTQAVNRQVQATNEQRIAALRTALAEKKLQLRRDLQAVKSRGTARAGFTKATSKERSR